MFFAGLFAMWFTSRANGQEGDWAEHTAHINVPMGFLITAVLITSSVTSQFGVFAAERGDVYKLRLWYSVTLLLGVVFLGIMAFEWTELIIHGVTIQSSVFGSVFYILTGFHAAHVAAGLISSRSFWRVSLSPSSRLHRQPQRWQCLTTGTSSTLSGSACS